LISKHCKQLHSLQRGDALATHLSNSIAGTSDYSNGVGTMGQSAKGSYNQCQTQQVLDKLDELINELRR
jgi:hypothetical protein